MMRFHKWGEIPRSLAAGLFILNNQEEKIFKDTIDKIEKQIGYFRYRAIENLTPQVRKKFFPDVTDVMINALTGIIRTGLVKRMESSFYAFRESIKRHIASLNNMIDMFNRNEILVGGISNLNELIAKGVDFAEIERKVIDKGGQKFTSNDFDPDYLSNIKKDKTIFENILKDWKNITRDPKLDEFIKAESRYFNANENKTGKLVIFSESLDTAKYLSREIENLLPKYKGKVLLISSENRKELFETIQENFDANYEEFLKDSNNPKFNAYNIIVSTDVLAEGVNLHRANVIVNYDTPWNATKLMQRLGRVNRIGSTSQWVYNYCFYPSAQGEDIIKNKQKAQIKIQAFHTAFGEDAKIYTIDEMIQDVKLYEQGVAGFDEEDKTLKLLWKIRHLQEKNPKEFERIKKLPLKAATARKHEQKNNNSIVFLKSDYKTAFYKIENGVANALTFEQAEELFRAEEKENSFALHKQHYDNVELARREYEKEFQNQMAEQQQITANNRGGVQRSTALKNLRGIQNSLSQAGTQALQIIYVNIESGRFTGLEVEINKLLKTGLPIEELEKSIINIAKNYEAIPPSNIILDKDVNPKIVLSENFLE